MADLRERHGARAVDTRVLQVGASGERDRGEVGERTQPDSGEPLAVE